MNVKLFSLEDTYILPNGESLTGQNLATRSGYEILNKLPSVLEMNDTIIRSFKSLAAFADEYGIEYDADDVDGTFNKALEQKNIKDSTPVLTITDTVRKAASFAALSFTDEQALEVPDLYPAYEVNHNYKKNERFTYNGRLFKVNQDHTSAAQWVPGETGTESLYTNLEMAGDGYLVWTQPTGAHNAYNTGDIVHYPTKDDQLYKSLIDGNTTVPGSDERWWEIYNEA